MSPSSRLAIAAGAAMLALTLQPAFANHTPTHTKAQIKKLNKKIKQRYTKAQVEALLAGKADVGDSYTTNESDARYRRYERTIVVPTGGTHAQNGAALQNAVAGISGTETDNGYVLLLEPGRYDLGSTPLVLPDYVSLLGSGRRNTVIDCECGSATETSSATLVTGLEAEVRSLEVQNVDTDDLFVHGISAGGDGDAEVRISDVHVHVSGGPATEEVIGIRDPSKPIRIHDVEVRAVGGANSYTGIQIGSLTGGTVEAEVTDVTAVAQTPANFTAGIRLLNADTSVDGGHFKASDALNNYAIYAEDSEVLIRGAHADATGGGAEYHAIFALNSPLRVIGSVLDAVGQQAYGVTHRGDEAGVVLATVDSSTIRTESSLSGNGVAAEQFLGVGTPFLVVSGSQIWVDPGDAVARAGPAGTVHLGGTLMIGGDNLTSGVGAIGCTAVRDEDGDFFADTCPTDVP